MPAESGEAFFIRSQEAQRPEKFALLFFSGKMDMTLRRKRGCVKERSAVRRRPKKDASLFFLAFLCAAHYYGSTRPFEKGLAKTLLGYAAITLAAPRSPWALLNQRLSVHLRRLLEAENLQHRRRNIRQTAALSQLALIP